MWKDLYTSLQRTWWSLRYDCCVEKPYRDGPFVGVVLSYYDRRDGRTIGYLAELYWKSTRLCRFDEDECHKAAGLMHRLAYTMTFYCNPDEYKPDEEQNEAENNGAAPEAEWGSQRPRSDGASHTTDGLLTAATGACTVPIDDALGCSTVATNRRNPSDPFPLHSSSSSGARSMSGSGGGSSSSAVRVGSSAWAVPSGASGCRFSLVGSV